METRHGLSWGWAGIMMVLVLPACMKQVGEPPAHVLAPTPELSSPVSRVCDPEGDDLIRIDLKFSTPAPVPPARRKASSKKLQPSSFDLERKTILGQVLAGKPVSGRALLRLTLEQHAAAFNGLHPERPAATSADVLSQQLEKIVAGADPADAPNLKLFYEENLERSLSQSLLYNNGAPSVADVLLDGRVQCYSGTVLNQLASLKLKGPRGLRDDMHVVIFEDGHVLPGFLLRRDHEFYLHGVETTASGRALAHYGPTSALGDQVRVVDSNYFLVVELLKDLLGNARDSSEEAVRKTAMMYGIDITRTEEARGKKTKDLSGVAAEPPVHTLNQTPFAFGTPDAGAGDRIRERLDRIWKGTIPEAPVSTLQTEPATHPMAVEFIANLNGELAHGEVRILKAPTGSAEQAATQANATPEATNLTLRSVGAPGDSCKVDFALSRPTKRTEGFAAVRVEASALKSSPSQRVRISVDVSHLIGTLELCTPSRRKTETCTSGLRLRLSGQRCVVDRFSRPPLTH